MLFIPCSLVLFFLPSSSPNPLSLSLSLSLPFIYLFIYIFLNETSNKIFCLG